MATNRPWWVVVVRWDMQDNDLPPYAVGPYASAEEAEAECDSESSKAYALLTIDAKNEKYQAVDCYWTQNLPADAICFSP